MTHFRNKADLDAIEAEGPWEDRDLPRTMHAFLGSAARRFPNRPAISYQLESGPEKSAETQTWSELFLDATRTANLFRSLGIGETDVVAYVLPNATETFHVLLGGMIAGIVAPINPLMEPAQIAAILRETGAKVVVALKTFPKAEVAGKVAEALTEAPDVRVLLEVDLNRYLRPPKSWIAPFLRPKHEIRHTARILDFNAERDRQPATLAFPDSPGDRVAAYFHTGGTTGMPKVAQHRYSGMVYNGWIGHKLLFSEKDSVMCPLPLFHVFAVHVILMSMIASGAHGVFPTPAGYRGEGVFDNFWKLVERWKITFVIGVPTAFSALMQRKVDADISSVQCAFSGSAPLPLELFRRFEEATGVQIVEGYGLTEATCLVACNPVEGEKRVGSIGLPFPYTRVKIVKDTSEGPVECGTDEIGEICVSNPGVWPGHTYTEAVRNEGLYYRDRFLRTGDLGRVDPDGYIWITGRAKDLIIRGGHNIDPAVIEECLAGHPAVAMAGAIGQPDAHAGEIPCAFVELVSGAEVSVEELLDWCRARIPERAALPKHIVILEELPKTAVGKVFKPDLRRQAITRVFDEALAGTGARVTLVVEDKRRGLVAKIAIGGADREAVAEVLDAFAVQWDEV